MELSQFDYDLPGALIAQQPAARRTDSRLLCLDARLRDLQFSDFPGLLHAGDLLVMNNTRVIPARLYGRKITGGRVEIMLERVVDEQRALVQLKASKTPRQGQVITIQTSWVSRKEPKATKAENVTATVLERDGDFFLLEFSGLDVLQVLERFGQVPLPPYIQREPGEADPQRYQTVYARHNGAVAAPTAGLHFDQAMLDIIETLGVQCCEITLHVGAGTFQPVRADDITRHRMHREVFRIDQMAVNAIRQTRQAGGRVIAVGTTSVRALESAWRINGLAGPLQAETDIFIYPGFEFNVVDALLTNFHLPGSTLLMLVSAFSGHERIMQAYRHAVVSRYRFFSYGDAMFMTRSADAVPET